jgi:general L-amino acid transport system permease protein
MSSDRQAQPEAHAPLGPPQLSVGALGWMRANLFNSWYNAILTVAASWLILVAGWNFFRWSLLDAAFGLTPDTCKGIDGACWSFIADMWPLFIVGTYPFEERWRPYLCLIVLGIMTLGLFFGAVRGNKIYRYAWAIAPVVVFLVIRGVPVFGLETVDTSFWGGLVLTLILSIVGIVVSFPIGILLALGRRSTSMPIVKALCVGYIELIRGVPLITVLFMASVMLPLFFPSGFDLDKVLRAQIGIIMFAAAYVAEVVRGGLQAIPRGQQEAAASLGLNFWQQMVLVIMPQALRIVIPPLVNTAIALFKDTSLVTIIGLFDLLAIASLASANPDWLGKIIEAYVFTAAIYWIFCFGMSRYSMYLEQRFKSGQT